MATIALTAVGTLAGTGVTFVVGRKTFNSSVYYLGKDEQLRIEGFTEVKTFNGPGVKMLNPLGYKSATVVKAITLGNMDYAKIKNSSDGSERVEQGPQLLFLGPYDSITEQSKALSMSSTEYVTVEDKFTGQKSVVKGPRIWFPKAQEKGTKSVGLTLTNTDYVLVDNQLTGDKKVIKGPCVWIPGPLESGIKGNGTSLSKTEYIHIEDRLTGDKSTLKGPCVWIPGPYESAIAKHTAISLQDDQYIKIKDASTGERWVQRGKALVFLESTWTVEGAAPKVKTGIRQAWVLKSYEFVRLVDNVTGKTTTHRGEKTVFPGPDEECLDEDKQAAIDLKVHEYVKILDQSSGNIRVERGSTQVFLGPNERVLDNGKKKAIEVTDEHAVLVRDKRTGQISLVTEKQLFVPAADESVEEIRDLIRLADHEAMIIKDNAGFFHYYYGDEKKSQGKPRAFFLPPYAEIVKLCWSRGRRREKRDLYIDRFDTRAQYMQFEFNSRTKDNVELILEGTFFWEVVDLPLMVQTTGDTSGDICAHARSQFIKNVAKYTLKEFMDDLSAISSRVHTEDVGFYQSRGVKVHSLEVTRYQCACQSTSLILQEIIQETTNRMNRLSQQESQNEVALFGMQGQISQQKLKGELLQIEHEHAERQAEVRGAAEAQHVAAFMKGITAEVPKIEDRLLAWQTLRKADALGVVAQGEHVSLYYTPNDVDLSIQSKCKD